jgi:hypothetical protein
MSETMQSARKDDTTKQVRPELFPPVAFLWIALALTYGVRKYHDLPADNWRRVPEGRARYVGALLRHLFAVLCGEFHDRESGLPHLAHAGACVVFLLSPLAGDPEETVDALSHKTLVAWRNPLLQSHEMLDRDPR